MDEKTGAASDANEAGDTQSKKAAKKQAKEAAKAAKVITSTYGRHLKLLIFCRLKNCSILLKISLEN